MVAMPQICSLLLMLAAGPSGANLLANPGFEEGWHQWHTVNPWYEAGGEGRGNGISAWELDETVAHSGKRSARVQGKRNRGIALQALTGYPDRYRLSGWIRTQNLNAGKAFLLAEFKARDGSYLGGAPVEGVSGTTDWTFVSGEVVAPPGTRSISIDLLTSDPNEGIAWFDDIAFEDVTRDTTPPAPLRFTQAPANAGRISVRWNPKQVEEDVVRCEVFLSEKPFRSTRGMLPRATAEVEDGEASVGGLREGGAYFVRVVAIDRDGNRLVEGNPVRLVAKDTRAPRPVSVEAFPVLSRQGAVLVRWQPHRLDFDLAGFTVIAGAARRQVPARQHEVLVPFTGTGSVPVSVVATDAAGNRSTPTTVRVDVPPVRAGKTSGVSGVVRASGQPVAGATVTAVAPDGSIRQTASRADGGYSLALPTSGSADRQPWLVRIRASAPGFHESADALLLPRPGDRLSVDLSLALPTADLAAWSVSSLANVFPDAETPAHPGLGIDWVAVRGETEGAQVVLRGTRPFTVTGVEMDPLVPSRGAGRPQVRLRAAVLGTFFVNKNSTATPPELLLRRAPAEFPDPFLEGFPQSVPAGTARPLYVMGDVLRDATPGEYRGAIRIQVRAEGSAPAQIRVPVRLRVASIALPARPTLPVTHWFTAGNFATWHRVALWSEPFWDILRAYARDMAEHRQTVVMVPLDTIQIFRAEDGRIVFDFSRFDRWVNLFTSEGVGQRLEIMHFGSREHGQWEDKTFVLHQHSALDRKTGQPVPVAPHDLAAAIQRHLVAKGWLERSVVHIADEPILVNVASWREISQKVHAGAPKVKRIDAIHVPPEEVKGHLEVMVPQLNYFSDWHDRFMAAQKAGAEVWCYIAWVPQGRYPNRLIDYPAIKTRIIPWVVRALGATGYLHWGYNFWTPELKDVGFAPGDNWIVYPGTDGPRSCLRWEAFRDGLEDFELFRMLSAQKPDVARALLREAVRSATDYETDPSRLEAVRRRVIRALEGQTSGKGGAAGRRHSP